MRLYQTWKNYVAQVGLQLELPVVTPLVRTRVVEYHTEHYCDRSERDAAARRDLFEVLFDRVVDVYLRALDEGYPEAEAREITHVVGNWVFIERGWGELLEFPPDEREAYYERYRPFFDAHDITPTDPLGAFAPPGGLPDAPETPERLDGDYPMAAPGLTDDVYVPAPDHEVRVEGDAGLPDL